MKNYYEILEVSNSASCDIIKKVFKIQIKKYHPDIVPESQKKIAEEKVKLLNEAYDVLSDENKRREYDILLNEQLQNNELQISLQNQIDELKAKLQVKDQIIEHFLGDIDLSEFEPFEHQNNIRFKDEENKFNNDSQTNYSQNDGNTNQDSKSFLKWILSPVDENEGYIRSRMHILLSSILKLIIFVVMFFIFMFLLSNVLHTNVLDIFKNVFFKN